MYGTHRKWKDLIIRQFTLIRLGLNVLMNNIFKKLKIKKVKILLRKSKLYFNLTNWPLIILSEKWLTSILVCTYHYVCQKTWSTSPRSKLNIEGNVRFYETVFAKSYRVIMFYHLKYILNDGWHCIIFTSWNSYSPYFVEFI